MTSGKGKPLSATPSPLKRLPCHLKNAVQTSNFWTIKVNRDRRAGKADGRRIHLNGRSLSSHGVFAVVLVVGEEMQRVGDNEWSLIL
ncbi:hypothetical protein CRG98_026048 [Punica granatum]|uniref:Uncharacterized protein n=1 Tax=Punica granatum TaxID=22663 RepID=A0A2I0JBI5_PUNGR|nr:hypothetical protein CRG98_026048 [Punica granatum]